MQAKITALAVAGGLVLSGSAQAEPGFTADPESPAGVEYQIPLDTARGQGGGGYHGGNPSGGGGAAPGATAPSGGSSGVGGASALFGRGIKSADKERVSGKAGGGQQPGVRQKPGGDSRVGRDGSPATLIPASASYSATGPVAGVVGGVLLIGGGIGLFLRLRGRRGTLA